MIKQSVLGLVTVLMLAGCGEDREKIARERIAEVKTAFDSGKLASGALKPDDINRCVAQMTETKVNFEAIQKDYAETQAIQSMESQVLYGKVRGQLATCKQTKDTLGY